MTPAKRKKRIPDPARDRVERVDGGLILERGLMPLTFNVVRQGGSVKWQISAELKSWRSWAVKIATGLAPLTGPVHVTVYHLRVNRAAMPDTGAPILAAKAIIDGLVEAGLIPSDGPDVVRRLAFEAPLIVGYHGVRLMMASVLGDSPVPHTFETPTLEGI